jgi:D-alanyl-D-alanine carboxypeptidase
MREFRLIWGWIMKRAGRSALAAFLLSCGTMALALDRPDPQPTPIELARLDGFAQGLTQADQFSGVVLVAKNGRILLEKAYGKRDEKGDALATIDTRYNLASAGKMFTSVAIWQQIAAHRLTLDTRVGAVLKDYPNRDFAAKATVRQLLSHTSGAGEVGLFGVENAANRARIHTVAEMVAAFGKEPPAFEPGSNQQYSNFGFVILGRIVEVLSGENYESYVARHVFGPAGMTHTGFVPCTTAAPDIAIGYATIDGKRQSNCLTQPARGFPAGGELSTAGDMFRFVSAFEAGKLVPPRLFAQAIKPYRQFMGLGFFSTSYTPDNPWRDFRWGHGGSSDGACTDVRTYPRTGETIIVLTNRDAPACFPVANFLHAEQRSQKAVRDRAGKG